MYGSDFNSTNSVIVLIIIVGIFKDTMELSNVHSQVQNAKISNFLKFGKRF